jgi:hypothetical protein
VGSSDTTDEIVSVASEYLVVDDQRRLKDVEDPQTPCSYADLMRPMGCLPTTIKTPDSIRLLDKSKQAYPKIQRIADRIFCFGAEIVGQKSQAVPERVTRRSPRPPALI